MLFFILKRQTGKKWGGVFIGIYAVNYDK